MRIFENADSNFQVEQIVVIENKYKIRPLSAEHSLSGVGFRKSIVINIDSAKKEGFIEKEGNRDGGDYYFNFYSCDFVPTEGDLVHFIPALNSSQNYFGKPIALRVSKDLSDSRVV